jgi:hypothetical protein
MFSADPPDRETAGSSHCSVKFKAEDQQNGGRIRQKTRYNRAVWSKLRQMPHKGMDLWRE